MKNVISYKTFAILILLISIFTSRSQDTTVTPKLIMPEDSIWGVPPYATLYWQKVANADVYRLQYSENPNLTDSIFIQTNDISYYFKKPLELYTWYYWKVQAGKYIQGNKIEWFSNWSEKWKFRTNSVLLWPPVMNEIYSLAKVIQNFKWFKVPGAKSYRFQLANNPELFQNILIDTLTSDSSLLNMRLEYHHDYCFRGCAINDEYTSNWSDTNYFSTVGQFDNLYDFLLSPPNYSTKQTISGLLIWKKFIEGGYNFNYQLQLYEGNYYDSMTIVIDTITSDSVYKYYDLKYFTNYTWKLRVTSDVDTSNWLFRYFRTALENPPELPEKVELLEPLDKDTINVYIIFPITDVYDLILRWKQSSPYIDMYWIEISTTPDFTNAFVDDRYNSTVFSAMGSATENTMNYWRVKAYNESGWGPFSDVWSFYPIYHYIGVDETQTSNNDISIFPNPVNDFAYIKIKSIEQDKGIIKIFNILGIEVDSIEYENNDSGETTINWKTHSLPTGTYFLKARIGNRVIVKSIQKF